MINREEFNFLLKQKKYDSLQDFKVDNAIIMAAGLSSRFAPVSNNKPKGLCLFKNEVLIERQIRQLLKSGINDIYVIVGYKKEMFYYLKDLFKVHIIENNSYMERNNTGSLMMVKDILANTYICSSDNYFTENIFSLYNYRGFYSSVFHKGKTKEWCITTKNNMISKVTIEGKDSYVMMGPVYFDNLFSKKFVELLSIHYEEESVKNNVWEYLYIQNLDKLKLELRIYKKEQILEFDTVEEALFYDHSFLANNLPSQP